MELHQRITNLVQKETDRLLKEFLNDNPDLLKKYVDGGVAAVGLVLTPLNAFMRHLLIVKGLDPDQDPGERQRRELLEAVGSLFDLTHSKDFDDDYDFSWIQKKFEETRSNLKQLSITKNDFKKMTDISSWGSARYPTIDEEQEFFEQQLDRDVTEASKKETAVTTEQPVDEMARLRDSLKELIKDTADKAAVSAKFDPGEAISKVRNVFEEINKVSAKKGIKTSKKKLNKGPDPKGPPAWGSKGVKVKRVPATVEEQMAHDIKKNSLKENIMKKHDAATKLVNEMVARGLCSDNADAIREQVQQVLLMPDDAVEALGRIVAKHAKSGSSADRLGQGPFRRTQK